jgi:hypothetical protein
VLALAIVIRKYRIDPQKREPLGAFTFMKDLTD